MNASTKGIQSLLSDFNHWCCFECLRFRSERKHATIGPIHEHRCCLCGRDAQGQLVREHPKSPLLKSCKGLHA